MPVIYVSEEFYKILMEEKVKQIAKNPENVNKITLGKIAEEMAHK